MIYLNLLYITILVVYVVDTAGFTITWKRWLSKLLTRGKSEKINYSLKPFDCSLCTTWWSGLAYLLFIGCFTLQNIAIVALFSLIGTSIIRDLITIILDLWSKLINKLLK